MGRSSSTAVFQNVSGAVYSVPLLGGEERLVIEDAGHPQVLPDNSIIFARQNPNHRYQLHRYGPETGKLELLNALVLGNGKQVFRTSAAGDRVVFLGVPASMPGAPEHLYALDVRNGAAVLLGPG
jgi:hypothetical protein